MYRRTKYLDKIYKYLKTEKLILLLWTRQVWKTTILETLYNELDGNKYIYSFEDDFYNIEFKNKLDFINYFSLNLWVEFYEEWYFFIDEFQYIKYWEKILKSIYDDKGIKIKLIVTWSWLWTYSDENKWTLVWRWKEFFIYSFDFNEFLEFKWLNTKSIDLNNLSDIITKSIEPYYKEYLTFWWYPAVIKVKTKEAKIEELEKIVSRYLDRDIEFFLNKNELLNFKKFFSYIYSQVWNLVKKEAIWEFLWIKVRHIDKYLNILEKTMFISRVYPYFTDKSKEYSSLPKIYFSDVWVINFLEKSFNFRENNWKIVENFAYNELQKNKEFNTDEIKIYKKLSKSEIDFIYEWYFKFIPIEIKSWNKKTIPKIFINFWKEYNEKITNYIVTSNSYFKEEAINNKKVNFIPNYLLGMYLNSLCKTKK